MKFQNYASRENPEGANNSKNSKRALHVRLQKREVHQLFSHKKNTITYLNVVNVVKRQAASVVFNEVPQVQRVHLQSL